VDDERVRWRFDSTTRAKGELRVAGIRQERRRSVLQKKAARATGILQSARGRRDDECVEEKWVEQALKVPSVRD
jgi:hypothetical protein